MAKLSEYVLTAEAADILGVSVNTVRNWAASGRIPVRRNPANNYRMFRREDLERFLAEAAKPVPVKGKDEPDGRAPSREGSSR
ncbi:MAG: MerR family transcriptional regulator [Planctomycetota bacterium]